MAADVAPVARITPISRRRSTTLMDMVLMMPMPPTTVARPAIAKIFISEGVLLGLLSWSFAVPLSYPGGRLFSDMVGKQILGLPLDYAYSWGGVLLWLVIACVLSALASLWPALQATRISVREALAYE